MRSEASPDPFEYPLGGDTRFSTVQDFDFEFRLTAQQREDFVDRIHGSYLLGLRLLRFAVGRFLGIVRRFDEDGFAAGVTMRRF